MKLKFVLKMHAILEALKKPELREDFVAGKIVGINDSESIIASLDVMESVQSAANFSDLDHLFRLLSPASYDTPLLPLQCLLCVFS